MADNYEGLTVKQLKDEVAQREGLTIKSSLRKAEIIDALREWDKEQGQTSEQEEAAKEVPESPQILAEEPAAALAQENEDDTAQSTRKEKSSTPPPAIETEPEKVSALSDPTQVPTPPPHHPAIEPQESTLEPVPSREIDNAVQDFGLPSGSASPLNAEAKSNLRSTSDVPLASADTSIPVSPTELVEDSRKRKRRSLTPPVVAEEVEAKRAKVQEGTMDNDVAFTEAHGEVEAKADSAAPDTPGISSSNPHKAEPIVEQAEAYYDDDDEVPEAKEPARHLATSGIYIKNLKRPLQEAALRRHLEAVARPKMEYEDVPSPIKIMYLIRSRRMRWCSSMA